MHWDTLNGPRNAGSMAANPLSIGYRRSNPTYSRPTPMDDSDSRLTEGNGAWSRGCVRSWASPGGAAHAIAPALPLGPSTAVPQYSLNGFMPATSTTTTTCLVTWATVLAATPTALATTQEAVAAGATELLHLSFPAQSKIYCIYVDFIKMLKSCSLCSLLMCRGH